jgi:hypothetical protein
VKSVTENVARLFNRQPWTVPKKHYHVDDDYGNFKNRRLTDHHNHDIFLSSSPKTVYNAHLIITTYPQKQLQYDDASQKRSNVKRCAPVSLTKVLADLPLIGWIAVTQHKNGFVYILSCDGVNQLLQSKQIHFQHTKPCAPVT